MSLKFYYDTLSQPCRAVEIFLRLNNIPFKGVYRSIIEGESRTKNVSEIAPLKKLPVIVHDGKSLSESIAIMRYISREFNVPDHWYPKDSFKQAKVDEYLGYHHLGTRYPCSIYVWAKAVYPFHRKNRSPELVKRTRMNVSEACDNLNKIWLNNKPFLIGTEISIADILAATELEQLVMTDFDPREGRANVFKWLDRVRSLTNPYYDELQNHVLNFEAIFDGSFNPRLRSVLKVTERQVLS